ncbi:MAG: S41 family peptidase [Candidatus Faecousia sp.]|uniref:S41 family peptidase n=1 Tax=Faecousia sp. TaxID=2952921 RepID=UPI002A8AB66B|nr:S41 family peptidase [Candidatus Faecousia sp.]
MKKQNLRMLCVLLAAMLLLSGCTFRFDAFDRSETEQVEADTAAQEDYHEKLDEIVALLNEVYVDGYDTDKLGDYLAQAAVAATGDRWSYYVSAEDYDAFVESNENAYVGIGVTVESSDDLTDGVQITKVTPNSPAEEVGIEADDRIYAVEGETVESLGLDETKNRIRGEEGTEVTLTILRGEKKFDVTVKRASVEVEVVKYSMLDGSIGYIKINNFEANSADRTIEAIDALRGQGAKALVFDLRFNPGGRKDELVRVLDDLLPEGPLFRSVDYKGNESVDYSDADCVELPMAVLVNGDSYSAAEFFAAALQEYDWATVVGTKTCGKANYQQTFRLSDGSAVAVSTGHYQTPHGVTLANVGVTPDEIVEVDNKTYLELYKEAVAVKDDAQLQAAIKAVTD